MADPHIVGQGDKLGRPTVIMGAEAYDINFSLIKPVSDLTGAFGIGGGNHLDTVGTVEKQHV